VRITPYLQFQDRALEAMTFYRDTFGGELSSQTFAEAGMSGDPSNDDRVMHAQLITDDGQVLMGSDVPDGVPHRPGSSISIAIAGDDEVRLYAIFAALSDGGTVVEALAPAPWGDHFGMVVDRFGTAWMVNVGSEPG
jgi:PhnB protein